MPLPQTEALLGGEQTIYTTYEVRLYKMDEKPLFSKALARQLLDIRHRKTFNEHLQCLGLNGKRLGWEEIKEVLALKLFIYARIGYHTRDMYRILKEQQYLPQVFRHLKIDVEAEFAKLQEEYDRWEKSQCINKQN